MEETYTFLTEFARSYGIKIIGAIVILIAGRIAAGLLRKASRRILERTNTDLAIISFVGNLVYILVIAFTVVAALSKFGVETASFVAILGAAAFAIGFALQGSLSNFASGVMLLIFRPIRIGDYVEAGGVAGTVKEIMLFVTVLATPDNVKIFVPNSKIASDVIKNYAGYDTRRIDLVVGIGYDSPIDRAHEIMKSIVSADERILPDPECQIAVSELADSSVNFVLRPWVKKEDYWSVRFDVTEKIKKEFDANGISIPYPQTDVHLFREEAAGWQTERS